MYLFNFYSLSFQIYFFIAIFPHFYFITILLNDNKCNNTLKIKNVKNIAIK
jgi:hypothetical protein